MAEMSPVKPEILMPAIYRFQVDGYKEASKWGWHRTSELVEAINTILVCQGHKPMTNAEICKAFPEVNLLNKRIKPGQAWNPRRWCPEINKDGHLFSMSDHCMYDAGSDWLTASAEQGCYIPAGIGMQLIVAVKKYCGGYALPADPSEVTG